MKNPAAENGFLMLVAVIFIIIIGFLGLSVAYMIAGSAASTLNAGQGSRALGIAYGGLEKSLRYLTTPLLSGTPARISCNGVTANANLTNSSLGSGTFTVTTVSGSPFFQNTTLSSAVTASATSIPLTSVSGLSASGRIYIDNEAIGYAAISGSTLIGVTRGDNGTLASSHASGADTEQYLCLLQSAGGIPSATSATWERTLQQGVSLQHGWAVGNASGNNFPIAQWNRTTERAWTNSTLAGTSANIAAINDISMLAGGEAWAVGNVKNSNFTFLHLVNGTWSVVQLSGAAGSQNLNSVSIISSTEAWAVGGVSSKRYTVLKWNGSTWAELAPPTIPADGGSNDNLNGVSVLDTTGNGTGDIGFAVGNKGNILRYNGSTWIKDTSPTTQNLQAVHTVSANEAWAVGAAGTILKWDGSTWATFTSPTATQLNHINMLDATGGGTATTGVAVGNSGVTLRYNGSSWSTQTSCTSGNLFGSAIINTNDIWSVGASGVSCHWNGSTWSSVSTTQSVQLNGIAMVPAGNQPFSAVQEIFP